MRQQIRLLTKELKTPIGEMVVVTDTGGKLRAVDWADYMSRMLGLLRIHYGKNGFTLETSQHPSDMTSAISRYFEGELTAIDALEVQTGGTPFQHEVWNALRRIPCGTTISYSQLAQRIGRPDAVRAVGMANGSNPVGVVVPCHRVIGAKGSLTGYGGGIERKRWLLEFERKVKAINGIAQHAR